MVLLSLSLSLSLLQYCITSWGGAYQNTITRLERAQNILLRVILNKPRLFHSDDLYKILDVPNLVDVYMYKISLYACKYSNDWTRIHTVTRQTGQIRIERVNKSIYKRHFQYLGKKLYNILPEEIKHEENIVRLKNLVKIWLREKHHSQFLIENL
uniref:Uncharacterized protein n=1 Tax=Cacopsylla melanoneura TaxID=428564 RepID=A0A8D8WIB8_9HEMI